jgi:hypothetical protein
MGRAIALALIQIRDRTVRSDKSSAGISSTVF